MLLQNQQLMFLILLQCFLIFNVNFIHPFYVSVTEMEFQSNSKEAVISTKFFTDDFEVALKKFSQQNIDLRKGDVEQNKKQIARYLTAHLAISINKKRLSMSFSGYENDTDATWCYFTVNDSQKISDIDIVCDFLYEVQEEQTNIFHVLVDGIRKSNILDNPEKQVHLTF